MDITPQEQQLCDCLKTLPRIHKNRYTTSAENALLQSLFWSLAGGKNEYMRLFFPDGTRPPPNATWKLRQAQGGADGDEFTEAARGKACGHIFKAGEATYRCKTCSQDDTCVLCSRCYDSSDHTGHMVYVSVSMGNSGCCDCGDPEAWRLPVHCSIHTAHTGSSGGLDKGKATALPDELVESIRMTIGRVFDYICDVISCSPEQLRLPKTRDSILRDEKMSRLTSQYYMGDIAEDPCEFALLLWNDEKHTVNEVRDQVAKACRVTMAEGLGRAHETDDIGRSILKYSFDVDDLLNVSKIIEQIKVTVTIRSARDTFREQMCGTIIEWLSDIAGCSVGSDHNILRQIVCEEMLKAWSTGSEASNKEVGMKGIDDHEWDESHFHSHRQIFITQNAETIRATLAAAALREPLSSDDEEDGDIEAEIELMEDDMMEDDMSDEGEGEGEEDNNAQNFPITQQIEALLPGELTDTDGDVDMIGNDDEDTAMEVQEATMAGYPPPPPPPPPPAPPQRTIRDRDITPSDSDTAEIQPLISDRLYAKANIEIPKTPRNRVPDNTHQKPPRYWLEVPNSFRERDSIPPYEDLWQRLRLDWMILFDLRMWKKVRIDLRDLYISTVVTIPQFKRILGLRFAGLYTTLAQLYLIADREPDHSIINISLQMLTTPSITAEIVERGNFLTNLMAILYTFLTTRQVGHPHEIMPNAVLAFDTGSVTNRRMYHFFMDLRYLFSSEHVQQKLRSDDRYILQFLDLVKLHQGICPNIRAVGEHVEYETDAWISASLITREINRLCRQFSESFKWNPGEDPAHIFKAIRYAAKAVILHSLGTERKRFTQAEIKDEVKFKKVGDYEFDTTDVSNSVLQHSVVKFVVESQSISFHHALHYTLSWLIECGKGMPREQLIQLLSFTTADLEQKPKAMGQRTLPIANYTSEAHLMAAFDYPLRVCAWLAQMKASMWVRNGMSLRHQQGTYRGVSQRDVSHHRDIFLLQTAMVVCPPARVLVSAIDRYGLEHWMKGIYEHKPEGLDDGQVLDVAEDFIHLLIVLISDRTSLISTTDEAASHVLALRRDITHVLCFKPLSFSEICGKLPEKSQDQEECQDILDEMTTFKPPEGLSDVGTFELKDQYLEDVDPYIAHYNKNQREESENAYKNWMAKKTGRAVSEIVFEPKLRNIESGVFSDLSAFTRTGIFAQIIYYALLYPLKAEDLTPTVPLTRVETFLQVVLHLVLLAIVEDKTEEDEMSEESLQSFVYIALTKAARTPSSTSKDRPSRTIVAVLEMLSQKEAYKACHPKITLVLKRMKQKRPHEFDGAFLRLGVPVDRISTSSPAINSSAQEREKKKQAALERQARVMAQMKQQQKNFLDNQTNVDWGEEELSDDNLEEEIDPKTYIEYPIGNCILCQEDTKDGGLYGTFATMTNSNILRQTDFTDHEFLAEVANSPESLDFAADGIRPYGVAGENREKVHKVTASGVEIVTERQFIGKGFPSNATRRGPVSVGCGHIMHYRCFEQYCEASNRRHQHQIARHHPEQLEYHEFVCPLCKALGNAFLPIIWAPKQEVYPGPLQPATDFNTWLNSVTTTFNEGHDPSFDPLNGAGKRITKMFYDNVREAIAAPFAAKSSELLMDAWDPVSPPPQLPPLNLIPTSNPQARLAQIMPEINASIWADGSPGSAAMENDTSSQVSPMKELVDVYRRLRDTMIKNDLPTRHKDRIIINDRNDLHGSDTLSQSLGYSIAAAEIQQRGVAAIMGGNLLDVIPQQTIKHLRVLSETVASYVSVGGIRFSGDNIVSKELQQDYQRQRHQLFGIPYVQNLNSGPGLGIERLDSRSLWEEDIFILLSECSFGLAQIDGIDIMHLVRICYLAEIVKVILLIQRNMHRTMWAPLLREKSSPFSNLCRGIDDANGYEYTDSFPHIDLAGCQALARKYALVFLRKVAILLHVRYGVALQNRFSSNPDAPELERLSELLRLPSFDEICESGATLMSLGGQYELVVNWVTHFYLEAGTAGASPLSLAHPTIFELIGLPKNYDTLMEETMKRRCPTTGKDISDPMLCLFCGEIFCGQSICCLKEGPPRSNGRRPQEIGGGQQHMLKCQGNIGLFINIRKCCIFYLYKQSGSWMVAPYIDKYGEVDPGLRHSRQLFLNQKRYDALLRTVWLSHGVPSVISRKLEMDINNGGWETI
ncbi:hypothetical protein B0O99DRAFT_560783 [Bisporella sp. PMI_857]|nr:hypothetical protein B0O99DRAFT_560783 [Bisporella sp. PMI_857]